MEAKVIKYTFSRCDGELLDKEIVDEFEGKVIYLDGVVDILCNGLIDYINEKDNDLNKSDNSLNMNTNCI